jgi:urocanate hydratase
VMGGVARRAWARNQNAVETAAAYCLDRHGKDHITLPFIAEGEMLEELVSERVPE